MTIQDYLKNENLARYPFVFVVTFARSGSTLLQGMLNAIDGFDIKGENAGALFHLYRAVSSIDYAKQTWGDSDTPVHAWYGANLPNPDNIAHNWLNTFFDGVLNVRPGTRCCGFKEIRHTMKFMSDAEFDSYLDFIERIFPGAAFVFNVRSIKATSKSGWWPNIHRRKRRRLLLNVRQRLEGRAMATKNSLVFSYDEWIENPDYAMGLFEFLGEPYDGGLVRKVMAVRHSVETVGMDGD